MDSGASKSTAFIFLCINLLLYFIMVAIASWTVNHAIVHSHESANARIFPIFVPMGNMATSFFIIFSLITGVVGFVTSLTSLNNVVQVTSSNLHAAFSSSIITWLLTLLSMGFACKEINIGWAGGNLRVLEVVIILVSGSQLICVGAIHAAVVEDAARRRPPGGRV